MCPCELLTLSLLSRRSRVKHSPAPFELPADNMTTTSPVNASMDYWQIVLLGDSGVGKTKLASQFTLERWVDVYGLSGMEPDFRKQLIVDNRMCIVNILDTSSEEQHQGAREQLIKNGQAFVLMYSVTSRLSFEHIESLHQTVLQLAISLPPTIILVGNKMDAPPDTREVSKEEGETLAQKLGCKFFETSTKTGQNVQRVFHTAIRELRQRQAEEAELAARPNPKVKKGKLRWRKCVVM
ncbi:P-loop containing nucleoside triphosphate hydrolase protein [Favolaschia claudopus]|uniref:P-loop containing nucleoside triphosphate hydrolase protein n=1 Tax=Favolaschia claudopus TaxID=2862362 RepID=A0AAW0CNG9_9AGAR